MPVWSTLLPPFLCEALLNRWTLQDVVAEDCAARCGHEEFRGADEPTALAAYLQQIFCESSTARQCFANHARCSFLGPHRVWSSQVDLEVALMCETVKTLLPEDEGEAADPIPLLSLIHI